MASIVMQNDAEANVVIEAAHQDSTAPLSGAFYIKCPNSDGSEFITRDFNFNVWTPNVDFYL